MRGRSLLIGFLCWAAAAQQVEIRNDLVVVRRKVWKPRESFMTKGPMGRAALIVFMTDYHVRFTYGQGSPEERQGHPGDFYLSPGGIIGLDNLTETPAVMFRIIPNCTYGQSQGPHTIQPEGDIFENECMSVRRIRRAAHKRTGSAKSEAAIVVPVTDMQLKVTCSDRRKETLTRKSGEVFWDPGGVCAIENLRGATVEEVRVVPKRRGGEGK